MCLSIVTEILIVFLFYSQGPGSAGSDSTSDWSEHVLS